MAQTKSGYLYGIWLENAKLAHRRNPQTGFFHRGRHAEGRFVSPKVSAEMLWKSRDEAYNEARAARCCPDGTVYRFYEFAYVMTGLSEDKGTGWTGKTKIKVDTHGQYIIKNGGVFRPQPTSKNYVNSGGYTGDLTAVRVKVTGGCRIYKNMRKTHFNKYGNDSASIREHINKWLANFTSTNISTLGHYIEVFYEDGTVQTWFCHGDTVHFDINNLNVTEVADRYYGIHVTVTRPKKLKIKKATTKCWRPLL